MIDLTHDPIPGDPMSPNEAAAILRAVTGRNADQLVAYRDEAANAIPYAINRFRKAVQIIDAVHKLGFTAETW